MPTEKPKPSPYEVLGVSSDASQADIKKAYMKLSRELHPDKLVGRSDDEKKQGEEKFKDVSVAYGTIGDKDKRAAYDAEVADKAAKTPASNPADITTLSIRDPKQQATPGVAAKEDDKKSEGKAPGKATSQDNPEEFGGSSLAEVQMAMLNNIMNMSSTLRSIGLMKGVDDAIGKIPGKVLSGARDLVNSVVSGFNNFVASFNAVQPPPAQPAQTQAQAPVAPTGATGKAAEAAAITNGPAAADAQRMDQTLAADVQREDLAAAAVQSGALGAGASDGQSSSPVPLEPQPSSQSSLGTPGMDSNVAASYSAAIQPATTSTPAVTPDAAPDITNAPSV